MSIQGYTMYSVECDVCGEDENSGLTYSEGARPKLAEKGWVFQDDKDYCPICAPKPLAEVWMIRDRTTGKWLSGMSDAAWVVSISLARAFSQKPDIGLPTSETIRFIEAPF